MNTNVVHTCHVRHAWLAVALLVLNLFIELALAADVLPPGYVRRPLDALCYDGPECVETPQEAGADVCAIWNMDSRNVQEMPGRKKWIYAHECWAGQQCIAHGILRRHGLCYNGLIPYIVAPNDAWERFSDMVRVDDCGVGMTTGPNDGYYNKFCIQNIDVEKELGPACPGIGNPFNPANGNKYEYALDIPATGTSPLVFERHYNSNASNRSTGWSHTYSGRVFATPDTSELVAVFRADGRRYTFTMNGTAGVGDADVADRLTRTLNSSGVATSWTLVTANDSTETFDSAGRLVSITYRGGRSVALAYSDFGTPVFVAPRAGLLISVTDNLQRQIQFTYDANGRMSSAKVGGTSDTYVYEYDSIGNLTKVTFPGGAQRTYLYDEPGLIAVEGYRFRLTGIIDENSNRYATIKYDGIGRAWSSENAGGANRATYSASKFTDARGTSRALTYVTNVLVRRIATASEPAPFCGIDAKEKVYDGFGNVVSKRNFNDTKVCYQYDTSRNLEIARVEGVRQSEACSVALVAPPARPDVRKVSTSWHPSHRLPWVITEPAEGGTGVRTTTHLYDSYGNLTEKTIDGPKNDGTSATTNRKWNWTYYSRGRVHIATDPNGKVTITEYYPDNDLPGRAGNIHTVTNHLGHVTTYSAYDPNGRPLTIADPNGMVTTLTYHPRGWLDTQTIGSEQTSYDYDAAGQLILVTMPDGSTLRYGYDAAHRLTQIEDTLGNRIVYTLDAMGNRIREETYDPTRTLARTKQRVFDSLNRERQAIGAKETSFEDVPPRSIARVAIEQIYNSGITLGCAIDPLRYCPDASVTRTQMAILLLRAKYGTGYAPPTVPATGVTPFVDVLDSHPYRYWIRKVVTDGLMKGRDATHFEPDASMRRDEMSFALVRLKLGSGYTAGPGTGVFADMSGNPYEGWAEAAKTQGITQGCDINPLRYCPSGSVTRASMALFFTRTISFPAVPNDQYCPSGTTYFGGNFGLSACTTGSCWAPTPFAGSTSVTGSSYPSTNYACATTPQMSGSIQSTLKSYDANGNPTTTKDPLGRTTTNFYDALNRPTSVRDPANGTTHYGYDPGGNLHNVKDPRNLTTSYTHDGLRNQIKQISPDTGTTSRTFDAAGNVLTSIDARGVTTTWGYDALGRILSATYSKPGTTPVTQTYLWDTVTNGKGRLAQLTEGGVTTRWTYTTQGRVATKQQVAGSLTQTVGYAYNAAGQLDTLTTPSGQRIKYAYLNGEVSSVKVNGQMLAGGIVRLPFGPVGGWQWGNGLHSFRYHDKNGRLTQWEHGNGSALLKNTLAWDLASRVTAIADPLRPADNGSYEYDMLDRLTTARIAGSNITAQQYGYDAIGNRLSRKVGIPATATTTYTYSTTSNRLASLTGFENRTYSYDGAGNPDAYGAPVFKHTYSNANRLVMVKNATATVATYVVNALGQRVSKTVGGTTTRFVYDEQGQLLGEYTGAGVLVQETVWLENLPLATLRPTGAGGTPTPTDMYYVHADHLGSPRAVTDPATNAVRWRWDNTDAFGVNSANENPGTGGVFKYGLRFPGQYYDAESGTHYNYYRDYDPGTGRYVQSDPIGLRAGPNTYTYVLSNPVSRFDAMGLKTCGSGWNEPLVPDFPFGFLFSDCCETHDGCYDDCRSRPSREMCDSDFHHCMASACQTYLKQGMFLLRACMQLAGTYARAVRLGGEKPFNDARKKCC